MAEVPIRVSWNSATKEIKVVPDVAYLLWGKGFEDTARWYFLSDDPAVSMTIEFHTPDKKGPFGALASVGSNQWRGSQLKRQDRLDKYTVHLSNGESEDPGVRDQEFP